MVSLPLVDVFIGRSLRSRNVFDVLDFILGGGGRGGCGTLLGNLTHDVWAGQQFIRQCKSQKSEATMTEARL